MSVVVKMRQHWDIRLPPAKKHVVAGKLVPTLRGSVALRKAKRRVVLELRGTVTEAPDAPTTTTREGFSHLEQENQQLAPDDRIVFRILKPRSTWGLMGDPESSDSDEEDETVSSSLLHDEEQGWVDYRTLGLDDIDETSEVVDLKQYDFEAKFGKGRHLEVRELKFASHDDLESFTQALGILRRLVKQRATDQRDKLNQASPTDNANLLRSSSVLETGDEDVNILFEIVSASDLPPADLKSSDPYVVVWCGQKELHRTKRINKSLDPIWTVDTGSLFLLSMNSLDFFASSGLTFIVKDYDAVGKNETLGQVALSSSALLDPKNCTGERKEFELENLVKGFDKSKVVYAPKLNLRFRQAKQQDFKFLKTRESVRKQKRLGIYADSTFVAPLPHSVNRLQRESKTTPQGKLHRVKPGPDPDREEHDTKWLSSEDIHKEHLKSSTKWIETGSGTIGRIFLEVLRCDGLPNKDKVAGKQIGHDVTDAFCTIIYEDAIVNTDVINDELSPRWMPWTQRAFVLKMAHPSSQVLIGVFDYDAGSQHDPVGRVSVDVTNFNADVDYVLSFQLHKSVLDEVRPPQGTLTIRLRIVMDDPRKALVASIAPPPACYVNVAKKANFLACRFVTQGEEDPNRLDMDALKSYGIELESYQFLLYYLEQAFTTVMLWRGHFGMNLCGCKFKLPLYSLAVFVMGVCLVENGDFLFSFLLFSIGLIFLATNEHRQKNPSPWAQPHTFAALWKAIVVGKLPQKEIDLQNQNSELKPLIQEYQSEVDERKKAFEQKLAAGQAHLSLANSRFAQEEQDVAEQEAEKDDIATKTGGIQLNPLKPILLPIQQILATVCEYLRVARSIITWDESFYAFIITNACFLGGLLILFVPWGCLIRWALRIVVWTLLGPWMKLVDIFVVQKLEADGDNYAKRLELSMEQRSQLLLLRKRIVMTRKEDSAKLRSMKRYIIGKFSAKVPRFKSYRYPDVPLAESTAKIHDPAYSSVRITAIKNGQKLAGQMIPTWGDDTDGTILSEASSTQKDLALTKGIRGLFKGFGKPG